LRHTRRITAFLALALALAGVSQAGEVVVSSNIATSTTWTANNTYNLAGQIYVLSGASLTIEAGTIVASTTNSGGSLAVCKGAKIFAMGTRDKPIIMTSKADVATWVDGKPGMGKWREASNEWGNLTIMGNAYISENAIGTNLATCDAGNVADMEGLTNGPTTDRYGGGNDDDDSGTVKYVSLRYGGKVVSLANELNGLSLGGIGRATDIHHVDIMNNVDDGVEIWGGTVNLKYLNIWNIGDDCFDVDQGWRGKAQFLLLVQGYSTRTAQGSGTGDNIFETDGAEQCDYQPVTTATIYNATAIGVPTGSSGSDHGTAWRDNARVQYRNCIFMDLGERLVSFDNVDGDGGLGYGCNGTTSWASTWTTSYTTTSSVNACTSPGTRYQAQSNGPANGKLAEIKDSVFYNNIGPAAYTEATARGAYPGDGTNLNTDAGTRALDPTNSPIKGLKRAANVSYLGLNMQRVIGLDPRPDNDALTSIAAAPGDGFFTSAMYRGAFAPDENWLRGWTACDAFGFIVENLRHDGGVGPVQPF